MKNFIEEFPSMLENSLRIAKESKLDTSKEIRNILITGLGGSGIGGTIVSQLVSDHCKVPIVVNKGYFAPSFVNEYTLVIVSSYSGNTEETLNAMEIAQKKGAQFACISSGGKVLDIAKSQNYNYIEIPGGYPPRAAFPYSFVQLFNILDQYGLIESGQLLNIESGLSLIRREMDNIKSKAFDLAKQLEGKLPIIYAETNYEGVAVRWRQQINENAKTLCWHHAIPEMNHNELVGWKDQNENLAVVILRTEDEFYRNSKRIEINKSIIENYTSTLVDIVALGNSRIERAVYLIYFGDWVSWYLSDNKKVDSIEVKVIDYLKSELSKI
ncbi:MAG: bifunctional phosphoglucose/phosphomannose isomerase [Flavobacteriales bacterium]|nr:bifunctional phosphoglucose/phosphomannose isomerase [Flavobacteriales bacterium]